MRSASFVWSGERPASFAACARSDARWGPVSPPRRSTPAFVRDHELAHAGLQLEALGPGYVPIHGLSQLFGGHEYNLFERWFINVPDW